MREGLSAEEREIGGELTGSGTYDVDGAMRRLLDRLKEKAVGEVRGNLRFASTLTGLTFLGGFACALCEDEKLRVLLEICVCGVAASILTGSMGSLIQQTMEAIYRLSDYSKAALPVVFTAAAASGAGASAAVRYAAVTLALDVLMSTAQRCILPLINAYLALTLSCALFPNSMLKAASRFVRWAAGILMTGTSLVFSAYIGMTGAISSAVNATAVKATQQRRERDSRQGDKDPDLDRPSGRGRHDRRRLRHGPGRSRGRPDLRGRFWSDLGLRPLPGSVCPADGKDASLQGGLRSGGFRPVRAASRALFRPGRRGRHADGSARKLLDHAFPVLCNRHEGE